MNIKALLTLLILIDALLIITGNLELKVVKFSLISVYWIIVFYAVSLVNRKFQYCKSVFPEFFIKLLLLYFSFVLFSVVKSLFISGLSFGSLLSIFGNPYNTLALLIPLSIVFSIIFSYYNFFKFLSAVLIVAILYSFSLILFNIENYRFSITSLNILSLVFLYLIFNNQFKYINWIVVVLSMVLLIYNGISLNNRTLLLKVPMFILGFYFIKRLGNVNVMFLKFLYVLLALLPVFFVILSFFTDFNIFSYFSESKQQSVLFVDTRTFLYQEVLTDLNNTNTLFFGKGSGGQYYSSYFNEIDIGENSNRITVEVGVLAVLLKVGIAGLFVYMYMILYTIYFSFFKAKNNLSKKVGLYLFIHYLTMFFESYFIFNFYNITLWIIIGYVYINSKSNVFLLKRKIQLNYYLNSYK